jgi:Raf kinase inhibitor-like YbhB/YbcL family protein
VRPSPRNQFTFPQRVGVWREGCPRGILLALYCVMAFSMLLIATLSCGRSPKARPKGDGAQASEFKIASTAFQEGGEIPKKFTCEGEDLSPPLHWANPPRGTQSFVLIAEDPDAPSGTWFHWVVYDLPARARELPEDVPKQAEVPGGGVQGQNSFGRIGYGGPCPPPGSAHHYFFNLYALDTTLNLRPGAAKEEVVTSAKGHVLGDAQFMGLFKR